MPNESLKLDDILSWTKGTLLNKNKEIFDFIGTDTRADMTGKLFIPLRGDAFDAHGFIQAAVEKGCAGIIFDKKTFDVKPVTGVTMIEVSDTLEALQNLASGYRKKLGKLILGITGSVGKTTAKEFTYQVLSSSNQVYASKGSLNNHWGVPFSLLNMRQTDQMGIIEMGMNHYGELQKLVEIADPDVVVCTMVGHAHFEHFGSQENIAKAKNEIYKFSKPHAIRVFNIDDPFVKKMREEFLKINPKGKIVDFSAIDPKADVFLEVKNVSAEGLQLEGKIKDQAGKALAPVFGPHNITNILAASSIAIAAGMSPKVIWENLNKIKTNWGRNQLLKSDSGAQVIFDGYNANPDSMASLIKNVSETPVSGRRILILGEMLELGQTRGQFHFDLGKKISELPYDQVIFYGPSWEDFKKAFPTGKQKPQVWASEKMDEKLINELKVDYKPGDLIAIKGSRGMKTEYATSLLVKTFSHEKI